MSIITIIAIMAFIFLALVASIPLYENYKGYSKKKKFLISGAVICLFSFGGLDVYYKTDPTEIDRIMAAINKMFNGLDSKFDKLSRKNNKPPVVDSTEKPKTIFIKTPPPFSILRFSVMSGANPALFKTDKEDSLLFKYMISNYGTGDAFHLKVTNFFLQIINGKIIVQKKIIQNTLNNSVVLYPIKTQGMPGTIPIIFEKPVIDSDFICYKIDFDDSTKKRKSFMKIYHIDVNHLFVGELEDSIYRSLESYLIKNKYWKPPFTQ